MYILYYLRTTLGLRTAIYLKSQNVVYIVYIAIHALNVHFTFSIHQAANQRKFDDWYAMYCILEDQYFNELKSVTNKPPSVPAGM